ncbi:MAG: thioredoxin family protein, partial [Rhodothermales bacterium]|nr:thioredoxin family protein [Rhodothermales bacterium]
MDRYLTQGARSIPRLVAFDPEGNACFGWGPAPAELRAARATWVAEGVAGAEISRRKLDWYVARGGEQVDTELANRIMARICSAAVV